MDAKWYALYTMSGQEEKVKAVLEKQLSEFHYVIYRRALRERKGGQWYDVERKLFPGYLLVRGSMTDDKRSELMQVEASFRILENDGECLCLSESEVKILGLLDVDGDGRIGRSKVYVIGDRIQVIDGPLQGQESRVLSVDKRKGRVKVRLDFCGSERVIELGIDVIEKV